MMVSSSVLDFPNLDLLAPATHHRILADVVDGIL